MSYNIGDPLKLYNIKLPSITPPSCEIQKIKIVEEKSDGVEQPGSVKFDAA